MILNLQLFQLLWLTQHQRSEIASATARLLSTSDALNHWAPTGEGLVRALRDRRQVLSDHVRDVYRVRIVG